MKTKIVYVVASLDDDIYMEQMIVSAWSARYHNPDCKIVLVCDQDTYNASIQGVLGKHIDLFTQILVKHFQPEQSMTERSRLMKTNIRNILNGDLLYLDTDTIVCGNLSYVDSFSFDLGFVFDNNCSFDRYIIRKPIIQKMKKFFDMDVSEEKVYYNGGVFYTKDTDSNRSFFNHWNELWKYSKEQHGELKDQQPLMKANIDLGYPITEMTGNLNCQVVASVQYLHTADVIHIYNCFMGKDSSIFPFYEDSVFYNIKKFGLTQEIKENTLNCKSMIASPSMPVPLEGALLWRANVSGGHLMQDIANSNSYRIIYFIWHRFPSLMRVIEKIFGLLICVFKKFT